MARTVTVPKPPYITIDFLFLVNDEASYLYWPTNIKDEQAFSEIRSFYEKLKKDIGNNFRAMPDKLAEGVIIFDNTDEEGPIFSLEEFLNAAEFQNIIRRQPPYEIRVNTQYGDFGYDMKSSEEQAARKLSFISHLDLSDLLPPFIFKTHRDRLTLQQVQQSLFQQHLRTELAKYGR